jgi:tetratricopeptide (TPR) repeat protein
MHGPKSAWVAVTKANLSNLHSQQGQRDRARRELLESIDIMKASFGPQHYLVAIGLNNLGTMDKTSHDYASAAKFYREALAILKKADLGDSLLSSYPMINLGEVLLETGQLQEAHEHIRRAQDILRTQSDPALPLRDEADGIEGTYLLLRGQFPEAEAKMKSSYEGLRQKTGLRSKQTQAALARLIRLYDAWDKQDLAAKYRKLGS